MSMEELFVSLRERRRPEDIAHLMLPLLRDRLDNRELNILMRAAVHGGRRRAGESAMASTFFAPVNMRKQTEKCREIFRDPPRRPRQSVESVHAFMNAIGHEIGWSYGYSDPRRDRLTKEERRELLGPDLSKRRYNKLFRKLRRMEQKHRRWRKSLDVIRFSQVAKSGLASELLVSEFDADIDTACFLAYFTARANLRSEFVVGSQKRAFDTVTQMLFDRLRDAPGTNWWAVAHVHTAPVVLDALGELEKGRLLARWFSLLGEIAENLRQVWERSNFARNTMTVRRGDDSSTWNALAGAWNKARGHWLALLHALGLEAILDEVLPGKVMRLMAADLVAMHHVMGSGPEPNTAVWAALPAPWDVLTGEASCPRALVERVCLAHGVDAARAGWTAPRKGHRVEAFSPTPELVHGVTVESAHLARILRQAGVFSGAGGRGGV